MVKAGEFTIHVVRLFIDSADSANPSDHWAARA